MCQSYICLCLPNFTLSSLVLPLNSQYCIISIGLARGVTCDTAVAIWHSGHLLCDMGQTEILTNILWHFKIKGNWSMKGIVSDNLVYLNKPIEGIVASPFSSCSPQLGTTQEICLWVGPKLRGCSRNYIPANSPTQHSQRLAGPNREPYGQVYSMPTWAWCWRKTIPNCDSVVLDSYCCYPGSTDLLAACCQ